MTLYIQYDPNGNGYFSTVRTNNAPQCPSNIAQIAMPDDTDINNKILDLSQNPPVLIAARPPSAADLEAQIAILQAQLAGINVG